VILLAIIGGLLLTWFLAGMVLAGWWAAMASDTILDRMFGLSIILGSIALWYWIIGTHINWGGLFV
jgi:hypothetical protein